MPKALSRSAQYISASKKFQQARALDTTHFIARRDL